MAEKYYEVKISFNDSNYEDIMNLLYLEGIENILEEEGQLIIYLPEVDKEKSNENSKVRIALLRKSLEITGLIGKKDFSSKLTDDKNWNEEWERSIEPVYIDDKIIVYPSWKEKELNETKGKILIQIDPKMSFGTGHNETTQLVLELMSKYIKGTEENLFDFGCGTGILSIAGIKLGVGKAVAVDIDKDSISNAWEYAEINEVHENIDFIHGSLKDLKYETFDIVCANIIRSVIVDNFPALTERINPGGKLFLSGILMDDDQEILEHLTQLEYEVVDIQMKTDWIGVFAVKI
ncbi:MAG TPA: 50S ribosomal protein L11 methyltransferase [Ignavibacteria bacterium]|nr:50S ribosomal protein L11 methyltransferase [Ignavibacteria bacterium]HQY51337.1 50S ribosomal protein L11 methyltransferase [Ignavibacteria bacterium]HRA99716.1 50S ribosomal protein L11 methyltransferase [Ignavibacteria bacterium]